MKKFSHILLMVSVMALAGCQSISQMSVDYLQPADVSFPEQLKKVAVINNMSDQVGNSLQGKSTDQSDIDSGRSFRQTRYLQGDASVTAEALAEALADGNFFDEVVISDSLIHSESGLMLSGQQVSDLAQQLDADVLIAIENVSLRSETEIEESPYYGMYIGAVDVKTAPVIRLYFPAQPTAHPAISKTDSIYWESYGATMYEVKENLIDKEELTRQASEFAGTEIARSLVPSWHTVNRYYFAGGSVDMRDAAVSANEHNWPEAIRLWKKAYDSTKNSKKKMYAAYNLAFGYEMTDSLETAVQWCQEAQNIAAKIEHVDANLAAHQQASNAPRTAMANIYLTQLLKRRDEMQSVRIQMSRFKEDF